jgi:hypothetical protein
MGHPGHTRWRVAWIISVRTYRAWYLLRFFMKPTSFSACIISIRPFRFVSEEEIEGHPAAPCVNDNTYCTAEMFLATRGTWHKEILRSPCASHVWRKRFFFFAQAHTTAVRSTSFLLLIFSLTTDLSFDRNLSSFFNKNCVWTEKCRWYDGILKTWHKQKVCTPSVPK